MSPKELKYKFSDCCCWLLCNHDQLLWWVQFRWGLEYTMVHYTLLWVQMGDNPGWQIFCSITHALYWLWYGLLDNILFDYIAYIVTLPLFLWLNGAFFMTWSIRLKNCLIALRGSQSVSVGQISSLFFSPFFSDTICLTQKLQWKYELCAVKRGINYEFSIIHFQTFFLLFFIIQLIFFHKGKKKMQP